MHINYQQTVDLTIVQFPQRLVFSNADESKEEVFQLIEQGHNQITFALNTIEFMDSSGLTVLVACYKKIDLLGGQISLLSPSKQVKMLLELAKLDQIFEIHDSIRSAVNFHKAA